MGAASATALSAVIVGVLQIVELRMLENVRIRPRDAWMPYAAAAMAAGVLGFVWDPAAFGNVGNRLALALGTLIVYGAALWTFGHPELRRWAARKARPPATAAGVVHEENDDRDEDR